MQSTSAVALFTALTPPLGLVEVTDVVGVPLLACDPFLGVAGGKVPLGAEVGRRSPAGTLVPISRPRTPAMNPRSIRNPTGQVDGTQGGTVSPLCWFEASPFRSGSRLEHSRP